MDNEVTIPIDGNHRTMCRFSDPQEPRYQPVITILARLINEVLQKGKRHNANTKDVVSTMLASFTHPDFRQHKDRNPLPLPGTCTWLLDNPVYTDWLKDVDSCLLWVSADPGCGKSVIASHLINTRMGIGPDKELDLCYFFFKTDYQDQRSAVVGLQGLLLQLFERYPTLKKFAAELMGDRSTESIDILWEVFVKVVLKRRISDHISAQCTFCILDGLDECDKVDRRIFTRLISQTFGLATSKESEKTTLDDASEMTSIKMLVLSRPDNAIKVAFDRPTPLDPPGSPQKRRAAMIRLRGEDETRAISADVGRVINASVKGLIEQGLPHDLLGDIQRQLVKRADRTFLWVTLILQLLAEKVETGVSRRELHSILDNRDIDKLYSDLLVMRPDVAKARKVLSILLAAVRPLTVAQMSIALAVEPDHDILRPANHPRRPDYSTFQDLEDNLVYPFETHLKFICGNFIRIIQNKVYLVHETAREFLLGSWSDSYHGVHYQKLAPVWDEIQSTVRFQTNTTSVPQTALDGKPNTSIPTPAIHTNSPWQHSFTLVESNALILQICTTFLYMTAKKSDLSIVGKPSEKATEFLSYAAQSWSRHFGAIREFVRLKDLRYYENLCHPAFPGFDSWTEALLGSYGRTNVIVGRSMDQIQDHLVKLLGIELTGPSNDDNSSSGGGASENEEDDGDQVNDPLSTRALADEAMTRLSSNPASQTNSYFPILVDETGFVGININATSGGYRTNYRNRPAR